LATFRSARGRTNSADRIGAREGVQRGSDPGRRRGSSLCGRVVRRARTMFDGRPNAGCSLVLGSTLISGQCLRGGCISGSEVGRFSMSGHTAIRSLRDGGGQSARRRSTSGYCALLLSGESRRRWPDGGGSRSGRNARRRPSRPVRAERSVRAEGIHACGVSVCEGACPYGGGFVRSGVSARGRPDRTGGTSRAGTSHLPAGTRNVRGGSAVPRGACRQREAEGPHGGGTVKLRDAEGPHGRRHPPRREVACHARHPEKTHNERDAEMRWNHCRTLRRRRQARAVGRSRRPGSRRRFPDR
jgi:hypothetical protein